MPSAQTNDCASSRHRIADYPALAALRLVDTDLDELKRQGKLCVEWRGQRPYFKLRFRRRGKQVVRYVGNAQKANAVARELQDLRTDVRLVRKMKSISRLAGMMLRDAKTRLQPIFEKNGLFFHGMSVRRARQRTADTPSFTTTSERTETKSTMSKPNTQTVAAELSTSAGELSGISSNPARHEARLNRVLDYQASSLKNEELLDANMGAINGGLMLIASWSEQVIEQFIMSGPPTLARLHEVTPAIDTHLRVTRQVDRFAQIEILGKESRRPKKAENAASENRADSAPRPAITQSEESEI